MAFIAAIPATTVSARRIALAAIAVLVIVVLVAVVVTVVTVVVVVIVRRKTEAVVTHTLYGTGSGKHLSTCY